MSFELARPFGNRGDLELSNNRADSGAPQQIANMDAWISSSLRVTVSITETLFTLPSRSTSSSRATLFSIRVKFPVLNAFGNIDTGTLKTAPTSHPSMQRPQ